MYDLKEIGKRLSEYMAYHGIGVNKLGRMCNTSGAQIHNISKGKIYGTDKLLNIFKACPDLDVNWLLYGIGEIHKEKPSKKTVSDEEVQKLINQNKDLLLMKEKAQVIKGKLEVASAYMESTIHAYQTSIKTLSEFNNELCLLIQKLKPYKNSFL